MDPCEIMFGNLTATYQNGIIIWDNDTISPWEKVKKADFSNVS